MIGRLVAFRARPWSAAGLRRDDQRGGGHLGSKLRGGVQDGGRRRLRVDPAGAAVDVGHLLGRFGDSRHRAHRLNRILTVPGFGHRESRPDTIRSLPLLSESRSEQCPIRRRREFCLFVRPEVSDSPGHLTARPQLR